MKAEWEVSLSVIVLSFLIGGAFWARKPQLLVVFMV